MFSFLFETQAEMCALITSQEIKQEITPCRTTDWEEQERAVVTSRGTWSSFSALSPPQTDWRSIHLLQSHATQCHCCMFQWREVQKS